MWVGHFQSADADWQQVAFCVISIGPMCGPPPRQSIFCINKDKAHKRRRAEIEKIFNAAPLRRMHFSLNILFFSLNFIADMGPGRRPAVAIIGFLGSVVSVFAAKYCL